MPMINPVRNANPVALLIKISNGVNKKLIKNNFSKCAAYYDQYSSIQNLSAARLITKIRANGLKGILEIGCGTGNYTRLLRERFPQAKIKALDISSQMCKRAREKNHQNNIKFIVADAETATFKEKFDLISSNASLQWFDDLEATLAKYRDLLVEDGMISFSIFGPQTFLELNEVLQEFSGNSLSVDAYGFIESKKIEKILKRLFRGVEVEKKLYQEENMSFTQLLKKIKYTGVRGEALNKKGLWTAKMLKELDKIYRQKSKNIVATYEVLFCQGRK